MIVLSHFGVRLAAAVLSVPVESISSCLPMMAPLPSSQAELWQRDQVDTLLETVWEEADGFAIPLLDQEMVDQQQQAHHPGNNQAEGEHAKKPSTYGEITSVGARQLFHHMGMTWRRRSSSSTTNGFSNTNKKEEDPICFYDLGSGAGKLVVQAFLEVGPRLREAIGIELAPSRHQAAVRAWETLEQQQQFQSCLAAATQAEAAGNNDFSSGHRHNSRHRPPRSLQLVQGDLFQLDVSRATHVFVASLCFTEHMMRQLVDKLAVEAPRLQCVATLKPFPATATFGTPAFTDFVETSWTKPFGHGSTVYFYQRQQQQQRRRRR